MRKLGEKQLRLSFSIIKYSMAFLYLLPTSFDATLKYKESKEKILGEEKKGDCFEITLIISLLIEYG